MDDEGIGFGLVLALLLGALWWYMRGQRAISSAVTQGYANANKIPILEYPLGQTIPDVPFDWGAYSPDSFLVTQSVGGGS
jgi:hypothetical protein